MHGDTPLIYAARNRQMASVVALLEAGADTTIRCRYLKKTAAEWAREEGWNAIADCINHGLRFHKYIRVEDCQLHQVKGRAVRAIERDLKVSGVFVSHILHRLNHFCTGK